MLAAERIVLTRVILAAWGGIPCKENFAAGVGQRQVATQALMKLSLLEVLQKRMLPLAINSAHADSVRRKS